MRTLVQQAQRGDHEAFGQLVRRYGPDLFRLAVAVAGREAATDVTQDALLRGWRELPTLRNPDAFPAWMRRILVNRCRDLARSTRGVQVLSLDIPGDTGADGRLAAPVLADPAGQVARSADLLSAIARLSLDQRAVVGLHYGLDLPIAEVARTLGIPDGTAKSRLNAALVALRGSLGSDGDG